MSISEREYRAMLAGNDQLAVAADPGRVVIDYAALRQAGDLGAATERALAGIACGGVPTEHEEQVALFQWAAANEGAMPELAMLAAIPNGGYRPMATAAMLKMEGVKAGYPDIVLDVPRGRWHGMRIELKRADRSNHPTPAQREWLDRLRAHGYMAVCCYGAQEAIDAITAYLDDRRDY